MTCWWCTRVTCTGIYKKRGNLTFNIMSKVGTLHAKNWSKAIIANLFWWTRTASYSEKAQIFSLSQTICLLAFVKPAAEIYEPRSFFCFLFWYFWHHEVQLRSCYVDFVFSVNAAFKKIQRICLFYFSEFAYFVFMFLSFPFTNQLLYLFTYQIRFQL